MDETGAYYTEWSKPKRETSKQYINVYVEFRKMALMTLYARQQKRYRCKEQIFGLCGTRRRWDCLGEQHWNIYITICEIDHQSKFNAWNRALKASTLGQPRELGLGGGGRRLRIGDTCTPMADSWWCMAKTTTIL